MPEPSVCHPEEKAYYKGQCWNCWAKTRRALATCKHPGRREFVKGSGLCKSCYTAEFREGRGPSSCHPSRPEHKKGSGLCQSCYNRNRLSKMAPSKCHPEKKEVIVGGGLCQTCYDRKRLKRTPRAVCHPERPRKAKSTGLCAACHLQVSRYGRRIEYGKDRCEICADVIRRGVGQSAIDHCHASGKIRGLLCGSCNKMLGFARDDQNVLLAALAYLKKHQEDR